MPFFLPIPYKLIRSMFRYSHTTQYWLGVILSAACLCLVSTVTFAQSPLSGTVCSQGGEPLANASVVCLKSTSDSTAVAQAATDANGHFTLQKPTGMLPIRISMLGYSPKLIMASAGDVDTVYLAEINTQIDEARVGQSNVTLRSGGATYYPSPDMKKRAFTSFDVLDKLNIEQLVVNRRNESIKTIADKQVQLLRNGEPIEAEELSKLPSSRVIRVEYSDVPSVLYPDAAAVVNVIVKQPESGGSLWVRLNQQVTSLQNRTRGGVDLYFPHQSLEFYVSSSYENTQHWLIREESEYRFPGQTIRRQESPTSSRLHQWSPAATIKYRWYNEESLLSLSATYSQPNYYQNDSEGKIIHTVSGTTPDTLQYIRKSSNNTKSPVLHGYYHTRIGEAGMLMADAQISHSQESRTDSDRETPLGTTPPFELSNRIRVANTEARARLGYRLMLPIGEELELGLGAMVGDQYNRLSTSIEQQGAKENKSSRHNGYASLEAQLETENAQFFAEAHGQAYQEGERLRFSVTPSLGVDYSPFRWWWLSSQVSWERKTPSLNQISPYDYWNDRYLKLIGNPALKAGHDITLFLSNTFILSPLRIVLIAVYDTDINGIQQSERLAQRPDNSYYVLRSYMNLPVDHTLEFDGSIGLHNLWDMFTVRVRPSLRYYKSQYSNNRSLDMWLWGIVASASLSLGSWDFSLLSYYNANDKLNGEIYSHTGFLMEASIEYRYKQLRISLDGHELFGNPNTIIQKSLSNITPRTTWLYSPSESNQISIRIGWNFNWGLQENAPEQQLEKQEVESVVR